MPNIKGIDLSDGVQILSGEINTPNRHFTQADIEAYLATHDVAATEEQVNNFLASACPNDQIRVHIISTSPLQIACIVANRDYTIPDNWWEGS